MLIINADDFGLSHSVNLAVARAFERGLCTHCSIMPNMAGFEEACDLVRQHGLVGRVGLHLTLTEGGPVTQSIRRFGRFCGPSGEFRFSRRQRVVRLSSVMREALEEEIEGQIARCRERGIAPAHLDSHNHAHEEWAIASLVLRAALRAGIPRVRLCKTFGRGISPAKRLYRRVINARIRISGLACTDYFGDPDDCLLFCRRHGALEAGNTSWEVMVHPALDAEGQLIDSWLKRPLAGVVGPLRRYAPAAKVVSGDYGGSIESPMEVNPDA
jgi:predicted glycoside hydrolase/deacetylase ChbG (UPF0249 family)